MSTIADVSALLAEHGFARAREILAHEIRAARLDGALNYAAMGAPAYVAAGLGRREVAAATRREFSVGDARHALFVLAGVYDAAVRAGQPTLTVDGEQPEIVEQAHALRRAAL